MSPRKILIDTDPGVDDAVAIFMALASPDLAVVGLSTIFGNADIDVTTRNALVLLETAGRGDIPVARGALKPISSDYLGPVPHVHGGNGLGDAALVQTHNVAVDLGAADFIYESALASPGELTLVALGPLTNLALALQLHPDLAGLVAEVVVMGGNALVPGNATPAAEANINNDPEAADLVFGASWRVTMVGLDVTEQIVLDGNAIERIAEHGSPTTDLLNAALPLYRDFLASVTDIDGIFLHDPATVAYLLEPEAFGTEQWPLRVETQSFSRGKTWPNLANTDEMDPLAWRDRPSVNVCTTVDAESVASLVERLLLH